MSDHYRLSLDDRYRQEPWAQLAEKALCIPPSRVEAQAREVARYAAERPVHTIEKVREFHRAFGHPIEPAPTASTEETRVLRVNLIAEELCELCDALGVQLYVTSNKVTLVIPAPNAQVNLVEAADALGDLDYVVQGADLVFGFPSVSVLDAIHRSNMSKLGADGQPLKREDGKILKGPNYRPPTEDIRRLIHGD